MANRSSRALGDSLTEGRWFSRPRENGAAAKCVSTIAGTLTTPGLDRGKSCVGLWGVSPRDGYLAHNTTQGTQENLPTVAEVTASIRA